MWFGRVIEHAQRWPCVAQTATAMNEGRPTPARLLGLQFILLVLISGGFFIDSWVSAYSAFVGGLIFYVPHGYFTLKFFRERDGGNSERVLQVMWMAEVNKLVLTGALFAAVFVTLEPLNATALLLTFAVMVLSNWLAPLLLR